MKKIIYLFIPYLFLHACHAISHDHNHEEIEEKEVLLFHTDWKNGIELFAEYTPLVAGDSIQFIIHYTELINHQPIADAEVFLAIEKDKKYKAKFLEKGIYSLFLRLPNPGSYNSHIILNTNSLQDTSSLINLKVHPTKFDADKAYSKNEESDGIKFTKEQAWKFGLKVNPVKTKAVYRGIKCSGLIENIPGDELLVSAKTDGILHFKSNLMLGKEVYNGQMLFSISGEGFTDNSIRERREIAKAELDNAKNELARATILIQDKLITQDHFQKAKTALQIAQSKYNTLIRTYSQNGQNIKSSQAGYLKDLFVTEGQFVQNGEALALISKNKRLLIKADVSQQYYKELTTIKNANFKTAYSDELFSTEMLNGKIRSFGKDLNGNANFIPLYIEIDNKGNLLPGSFVELYLKTEKQNSELVVPKNAIMEDYENYHVYVQLEGENYEKRTVKLGIRDGEWIQVIEGLKEGDRVVTDGAYQVKMAAMSSTIPAHGHSH